MTTGEPVLSVHFSASYRQITVDMEPLLTHGNEGLPYRAIREPWGKTSASEHAATVLISVDGAPRLRYTLPNGPQRAKISITLLSINRGEHEVRAQLMIEGAVTSEDARCVVVT